MHGLRSDVQEEELSEVEMDHLLEFLHEWRKVRSTSRVWGMAPFSTLGSMLDKMTLSELKIFNRGSRHATRWM